MRLRPTAKTPALDSTDGRLSPFRGGSNKGVPPASRPHDAGLNRAVKPSLVRPRNTNTQAPAPELVGPRQPGPRESEATADNERRATLALNLDAQGRRLSPRR